MPRPKLPRRLQFDPEVYYFKPKGVPLNNLEEVVLESDELEAIKLYDLDGLDQVKAAEEMGISQPTFGRMLGSAHKKIAEAIVMGKAIKILGTKL